MEAALPEIRSLGAELVAVSQSRPEVLAARLQVEPRSFPFVGDPDRSAHRAFGLERGTWPMFARPRVLGRYLARMAGGWIPRRPAPGEDVLQLGGDFITDSHHRLAWAYRSADPTDRPSVPQLLAALRTIVK